MANITVTHTFVNGTIADGTEINTNFSDIVNGTSDGTKDFSINALTCAGTATLNGNVVLGNATGDTITPNGRFAADIDPSADNARDLGATALMFKAMYSYDFFASGGAVGTPSISFDGDTDTGIWSSAANIVNVSAGGSEILEIDGTSIDATVSIVTSGSFTAASGDIVTSLGAVGTPSHTFTGDLDTGMWASAANILNFSAGGTEILELDTTSADFTVAVNTSAGLTADGACTFNDSGAAVDFRVEGVADANLFFVDGSADKVGVGTSTPETTFQVVGNIESKADSDNIRVDSAAGSHIGRLERGTNDTSAIDLVAGTNNSGVINLSTVTGGTVTQRVVVTNAGNVGIGTTGPSDTLHVNGGLRLQNGSDSIDYYDEDDVTLTGSITGTCRATRIGRVVTLTGTGAWTHSSASSVSSGADLPSQYRPSTETIGCFLATGSGIRIIRVQTSGVLTLEYFDEALAALNATGSGSPPVITYCLA